MKALSFGVVATLAGSLLPQGVSAAGLKATQSAFNCHTSYGHKRVKKVARSTVSTTSTRTNTVTLVVHPTVEITPDARTETETALVTITTSLPQPTDTITETHVKKTDHLITAEDTCKVVKSTRTIVSTTTGISTIDTISGWTPIRSSWPEPSKGSGGGKQHESPTYTHTTHQHTTHTSEQTTKLEPTSSPLESTSSTQHTEPTEPVEPTGYPTNPTTTEPIEPTGYPTKPTTTEPVEPTGYPTNPTATEPTGYPTGPTMTEPTGYPTGSITTWSASSSSHSVVTSSLSSTTSTSRTTSSKSTSRTPNPYPTGGSGWSQPQDQKREEPGIYQVKYQKRAEHDAFQAGLQKRAADPGWSYADHQKHAASVHKAWMLPDVELNEGTGSPPNNYSSHSIGCVKILFEFVTSTITSTAKHTKTVVPECTTDITTATVTDTITKTIGSASSTVTKTTTFTNTIVKTGGSTKVTAHATVTEIHLHARATHYAQCDKDNMMSTWNGLGINYVKGHGNYHYKFGISSPYDCCVTCALDPGCKASAFDPENNFCAVIDSREETCDINGKKMTGVVGGTPGHSGHYQVVSNGACGYVSN